MLRSVKGGGGPLFRNVSVPHNAVVTTQDCKNSQIVSVLDEDTISLLYLAAEQSMPAGTTVDIKLYNQFDQYIGHITDVLPQVDPGTPLIREYTGDLLAYTAYFVVDFVLAVSATRDYFFTAMAALLKNFQTTVLADNNMLLSSLFTLGTEAAHARQISCQLKNIFGNAISGRLEAYFTVASDSAGVVPAAADAVAAGTGNAVYQVLTADTSGLIRSDANGTFILTLTKAAAGNLYLAFVVDGKRFVSPVIAFAG